MSSRTSSAPAGAQPADVQHHVDLTGAELDGTLASKAFVSVDELPCGNPTTVDTRDVRPFRRSTAKATSAGRTVADATPYRRGELDTVADEVEIELRSQERVVDRLRDLLVRQVRHRRLGHGARIAA